MLMSFVEVFQTPSIQFIPPLEAVSAALAPSVVPGLCLAVAFPPNLTPVTAFPMTCGSSIVSYHLVG